MCSTIKRLSHIVETLFDQCLGLIIHHLRFSRALYHRPTNMFFCFVQAHEALLHIYYRIKSRRERAERAERGGAGESPRRQHFVKVIVCSINRRAFLEKLNITVRHNRLTNLDYSWTGRGFAFSADVNAISHFSYAVTLFWGTSCR